MKNIAVLGSTGSIGRQTLAVADCFPGEIGIKSLAGADNIELLAAQAHRYQPELVVTARAELVPALRAALPGFHGEIAGGPAALCQAASWDSVEMVLAAISGMAGLPPVWAAIAAGKDIALANKEVLVAAGEAVMAAVAARGVSLLPVDSEHSAIFQCLERDHSAVETILLTASGGPFRGLGRAELAKKTAAQALQHPTWNMGAKITIDSATLMNKGLEVIEAHHLFGMDYDRIRVVVHPESIVHSLVHYVDGAVLAQLGVHDMRIPIQYALFYPQRRANSLPKLDLAVVGALHFEQADVENFPCLSLAYAAGRAGGVLPAVMNGANEVVVQAFLRGEIGFLDIPTLVEQVMLQTPAIACPQMEIDPYLQADAWARSRAEALLKIPGRL